MAANHDPRNVGREAPSSLGDEKLELVRELVEALTALGNYLAAAHQELENQSAGLPPREALSETLRKSLDQYERASKSVRHLRQLFFREEPSNDGRGDTD